MQAPMENPRSASERFLNWLEIVLRERHNPEGAFQIGSRRFKRALTSVTFGYFFALLVLLFLMDRWGERSWLLSIMLFMPPVLWLVPLVLLTPLHCLVRRNLCWITAAAVFVLGFGYLDFNLNFPSGEKTKGGLTLLTNNVGGRKFQTLADFIDKEDPDIVAMQDAYRVGSLRKKYPERFVANLGEFIIMSKFPIQRSGILSEMSYHGRPIAAWHELQYENQTIVVYNVHMPTPRLEFASLRGRGLLVELFGGKGIYSKEVRDNYKEFVKRRIELTEQLLARLQKETRPYLVAGDFNMPDNGYLSRQVHGKLADAFEETGRGYGFTFPGKSGGLLDLFGAWLRIDYVFANKNWRPEWCRVEPYSFAEHSAVIAQFRFQPAAHKP